MSDSLDVMKHSRQKEFSSSLLSSPRKRGSCAVKSKGPRFHGGCKSGQAGNALIYVLIAIALFAALSFTLSRGTDTGETGSLDEERAGLLATQLISYSAQAKQSLDQMVFMGADINNIDFTLPTDAAFDTPPNGNKIYHPEGGGLIPGKLPANAITDAIGDPPAGWYLGRFNNVEWTATTAPEIILVAYQIPQAVCEQINKKVTGNTTIPVLNDSIKETMIDDALYSVGANVDLSTADPGDICTACHERVSLCVQNDTQNAYGFYTILADQ